MNSALSVALPFVSVLLGSTITYLASVRHRRRTAVEQAYHDAISAVALAQASHDFISELTPWRGASEDEVREVNNQIQREANLAYVRAESAARNAIARASAYDPTLADYLRPDDRGSLAVHGRADKIMRHLRANIQRR